MSSDHDDVEREALEDSRRESSKFDMRAEFNAQDPVGTYRPALDPVVESVVGGRLANEFHHLEDLYARFPVDGERFVLRVEREAPKTHLGVHTAGYLCDLVEQLTTEEFGARFGGGTYRVSIRSFVGGTNAGGQPSQRTVATCRVQIYGSPRLQQPVAQETPMAMGGMMGGSHPSVQIKELEMRERERARAESERTSLARLQPEILDSMNTAAEARAELVRGSMQQQIDRLDGDLRREREALAASRVEADKLRRELFDERQQFTTKISAHETTRERELNDKHTAEVSRIRDERVREVEGVRREYEARFEQLRTAHAVELSRVTDRERDDRTRVQDQAKRDQEAMRAVYDQRLEERSRELERVRAEARDLVEREIRSVTQNSNMMIEHVRNTLTMQLTAVSSERDRLASETVTLRGEMDKTRRELFKPPLQAIREAQALTEAVSPGQDEGGGSEPSSWKGAAVEMGKAILPALLGVMQPRPGMPVQPTQHPGFAGPQLPPHMQPRPGMQGPPQQQRPAQQVQQPRRPRPAWITPQGPAAPGEAPFVPPGADAPIAAAIPRARVPIGSGQAPQQGTRAPLSGEPAPMPPFPTNAGQPQQQTQEQPQGTPQATPQAEGGYSTEQVNAAFMRLNQVIESDIPPDAFADEFIGSVGPQFAGVLVRNLTPQGLIEDMMKRVQGADEMPIATRAGRQYLERLWVEVHKRTGG